MKRGDATTDTTQRTTRDYYEQLYANKFHKPEEMDKLLETYNLSRLNHKEIENLNRQVK